jgi:hypothetical protein
MEALVTRAHFAVGLIARMPAHNGRLFLGLK